LEYDLVLIHPPSVYDFRKRILFLGPITRTVPYTPVFIMFPVGLLSIADFLDRHGYKVKILNLGEKMLAEPNLDVESYLKSISARVFGIDLHWCIHAQGAMETAKLCKERHPESSIVLGGLTATAFDVEIVSKWRYVDFVLRGEAEHPMLRLMQELDESGKLFNVPNLTYLDEAGGIRVNPYMKVPESLDEFEFTRLDLVEPCERVLTTSVGFKSLRLWNIPVCRGCIFNCSTCGGSAYSYEKLMKRKGLAIRSPDKIVEDFQRLDQTGINSVFMFQDMRMCGKRYWKELIERLHKEKWTNIDHVTIELFYPPDDKFLKALSDCKPADELGMGISPDSGDEYVRRPHGRAYPNSAILTTVESSKKYGLSLAAFFMIGLAEETRESLKNTWALWEKLLQANEPGRVSVGVGFCPMIVLDPSSPAFDNPDEYGYLVRFRNLADHIGGMSSPSWKYWMNYETKNLKREDLVALTLESSIQLTNLYKKFGMFTGSQASSERVKIGLERIVLKEVDQILMVKDEKERERRLKELDLVVRNPSLAYSYLLTSDEGWETLKEEM